MKTAIETYTAHTYSCGHCNWQVSMIYERSALGSHVTNESLRELRKYAEGRDIDKAPVLGTYCLTCNMLADKS